MPALPLHGLMRNSHSDCHDVQIFAQGLGPFPARRSLSANRSEWRQYVRTVSRDYVDVTTSYLPSGRHLFHGIPLSPRRILSACLKGPWRVSLPLRLRRSARLPLLGTQHQLCCIGGCFTHQQSSYSSCFSIIMKCIASCRSNTNGPPSSEFPSGLFGSALRSDILNIVYTTIPLSLQLIASPLLVGEYSSDRTSQIRVVAVMITGLCNFP